MNIGLVLSGGGYRGYAHIGVIKAIQELGIKISYLSGTSAGAVTAALFASGHDWQDILSFYNNTKVFSFSNYSLLKPGLIDSSSFLKLFEEEIKFKKFNQLKIKTFISATNMVTAKGKIFHEGDIIRPVVASASLPGIFSPMLIDGDYYCDGGIVNNFPVEPLQIFCDTIIGVYVNQIEDSKAEDFDSPLSNMFRAFKIMRANDSMRKFNQCDYLIAPNEIATYSIISKANSEVIFKIGYDEAMKILKPLS